MISSSQSKWIPFYLILTLRGTEIGKVPDKLADKEALLSQSIESLEVSG